MKEIPMTESVLAGFVKEALDRGIPQHQIPYLLKVAGWLQAYQANPSVFEQGMQEAEALFKQAGGAAAAGRAARGAIKGKRMPRPKPAPAAAKAPPKAPPKAQPKVAPAAGLHAAGKPPAGAAPAKPGFFARMFGGAGAAAPAAAPVPAPAPARAPTRFKGLGTLAAGAGLGGLAAYGGDKAIDAAGQSIADQRMLDEIYKYRNQYADFATKQNLIHSLPGLNQTAQPRLWSPNF